jgi:hypothetical protein
MNDFGLAIDKARAFRDAVSFNNNTMMFLDSTGYGSASYDTIKPGDRLISIGFYGPTGFVEHVQDFGVKP